MAGGGLGFVAVYFNPCGYLAPHLNFERFLERFAWMGDRLLVVELAFGEQAFTLTGQAENLLQLRSDSVLWQKEALINAGTKILRERGFANVGWLDGDSIIEGSEEDWFEQCVAALRVSEVVQVFEKVEHRFADQRIIALGSVANLQNTATPVAKIWKTGLGWIVRGHIWDSCSWYDLGIAGSGDRLIFLASVLEDVRPEVERSPQFSSSHGYLESYLRWAKIWSDCVGGKCSYLSGVAASSEEHGSHSDRQYYSREIALRDAGYDPAKHLGRDVNGLLMWSDAAPENLKSVMLDYFKNRREDG
ncbi:MAG: hypothetical protein QM496_14000 [Verrucomicrobiota bacterium]